MSATFPLADLIVKIVGDMSQFSRDMVRTETLLRKKAAAFTDLESRGKSAMNAIAHTATVMGRAVGTAFIIGLGAVAALTGALSAFSVWALKVGTSANELRNRFKITFGDQAERSERTINKFADAVGRSRLEIMDMAATLQNVFTAMGFGRDEAADLSVTIAKLGTDIASFHDIADSDAVDRLSSALVGNHEALRSLGIVVTETAVKQELLKMGFKGGVDSATDQQKMLARLNIILRATNLMHNDAANTAGSMANQFKGLWGVVKDLADSWGQALIPAMQVFVGWLKELLLTLRGNIGSFQDLGATMAAWAKSVVGWFDELMFVIGNYDLAWAVLMTHITQFIAPITDVISQFATSTFYVFEWLVTNIGQMWENLTTGMAASFLAMANDVTTNIKGVWDYIASGGKNFSFSNMGMGAFLKDLTNGTTAFEMPKVESKDWDAEWKRIEEEFNARRDKMADRATNPEDMPKFAPPDLQSMFARLQNNKGKIEVDLVGAADAFKNNLKDAFKDSNIEKQTQLQGNIVDNQKKAMDADKENIRQQTEALKNLGGGFF